MVQSVLNDCTIHNSLELETFSSREFHWTAHSPYTQTHTVTFDSFQKRWKNFPRIKETKKYFSDEEQTAEQRETRTKLISKHATEAYGVGKVFHRIYCPVLSAPSAPPPNKCFGIFAAKMKTEQVKSVIIFAPCHVETVTIDRQTGRQALIWNQFGFRQCAVTRRSAVYFLYSFSVDNLAACLSALSPFHSSSMCLYGLRYVSTTSTSADYLVGII